MAKKKSSPTLYAQQLSAHVRTKRHAFEVLRELVRLGKARLKEIPEAIAASNPGLGKLENTQVIRVLKFALNWGLVFHDAESKDYYPTTLARQILWGEQSVDWLPQACLAHSIIAVSEPGVDVVKVLGEELRLEKSKAEAVRAALESLPARLKLPWLGHCLRRGGEKVAFVPTEYPHLMKGFDTRDNQVNDLFDATEYPHLMKGFDSRDNQVHDLVGGGGTKDIPADDLVGAGDTRDNQADDLVGEGDTRDIPADDLVKKDSADLSYAPLMDSVAVPCLLTALRHAGFDDETDRVNSLPMGRQFLEACEGEGTPTSPLVFRPQCSVVSMSSPRVNPFALDLMLRYEAPFWFNNNFKWIEIDQQDPSKGAIDRLERKVDTDYAVLLRFVDPATRVSHFVVFGFYPSGTLAAAQYFRTEIDRLLEQFPETPFVVVLQTDRPSVSEWANFRKIKSKLLYTEEFDMVKTTIAIDIRYQPGFEPLKWLADMHPEYFVHRLGLAEAKVPTDPAHRLKEANRLMGHLQRKGILLESIIDALLIQSFHLLTIHYRHPVDHQRSLVKTVRRSSLKAVAVRTEFRSAFESKVLDYTWGVIDAQKEYLQKRLEQYDFNAGADVERLVKEYSSAPAGAAAAARTETPINGGKL